MTDRQDIADFDLCRCGDYRKDHANGVGRCRMPDDLTHGFMSCAKFQLSREATEIPEPYLRAIEAKDKP